MGMKKVPLSVLRVRVGLLRVLRLLPRTRRFSERSVDRRRRILDVRFERAAR
jgi:hypothetical protein